MSEIKKEYQVSRATLALALGALGSRGVGFFREVVVAAKFGTGRAFDLYVASSALPSFLSAVFLYALPDYLVPYLARLKENRPAALRRFLLWTFFGGAVFLGGLYFSAPLWVKLFAPGLPPYEIHFGVQAFQILLLFVFGTAIEAILRSYYQVEGRFGLTAASPLLTGLVVLGAVFLLSGKLSVYALAWGWAVGSLVSVAAMLIFLFFSRPSGNLAPTVASAPTPTPSGPIDWKGFSYVLAVAVLGQLMVLLDRFFGSFLPPESLSALYYASLPVLFPVGILIYPLGYAIFPKLSQRLAEGKDAEAAELLAKALGWMNFVLIPMSVIFILAPEEVIRLVFERGAFGAASTDLSARCLRIFAFSLLASGYIFVLSRVYLATGLGKRLAAFCLAAFLFKAGVAYAAIQAWGLEGLAGAGSAALVGLAFLQFWRLPGRVKAFTRPLGFKSLKLVAVSFLAFGGVWLVSSFLAPGVAFLNGTFLLLVFGFLYLAGCFILRIPEFFETVNLLRFLDGKKLFYGTVAARL